MYKTTLRLPAEYWSVIDSYGHYNKAINNAISFVLQEDLINLPVSRESNYGTQISRNITIVNTDYEIMHALYGTSRQISIRRIITYLIDNCLYEAFNWSNNSTHESLTPVENNKYKQVYKDIYNVVTRVSTLEQHCEKMDITQGMFRTLYTTLNNLKRYYDEKYTTQCANRDNTTRAIRDRVGRNIDESGAGNTDD